MIDFDQYWAINNIFATSKRGFNMKGKPRLHILYEYQLNTYLTLSLAASE